LPRALRRAVRPIQPGEEVATAYVELAAPRWERRAALLRHHLFNIDAGSGGTPEGDSASGSSSTVAQAVMQCLPQQQPACVLPLDCGAAGAAQLRLYDRERPPWPHDERDVELAAVQRDGGAWGGMWGALQQAEACDGAAAAAATASFGVEEEVEDQIDAGATVPALPAAILNADAGASGGKAGAQAAAEAAQRAAAIHCWWPGAPGEHTAAVQHLAERYIAALRLQHELEGLLGDGRAEAALQQLRSALRALCAAPGGLMLGPRHVLRMRLLADLHRAALAAGQWAAALEAATQLAPLYKQAYPQARPGRGAGTKASGAKPAALTRPRAWCKQGCFAEAARMLA
jgi:hypothetical protein